MCEPEDDEYEWEETPRAKLIVFAVNCVLVIVNALLLITPEYQTLKAFGLLLALIALFYSGDRLGRSDGYS